MLDLKPLTANSPRGSTPAPAEHQPADEGLPAAGQRYRHYKGALYRVEGLCTLESGAQPGVLYRAVDPIARQDLWVRPLSDFCETLENGQQRFTRIPQDGPEAMLRAFSGGLVPRHMLEAALARYDEPGRYFHDRMHLHSLFSLAEKLGLVLSAEQAVALLYHDIIYMPGAPEGLNEQFSAALLRSHAPILGPFDLDKAMRFVRETAEHKASCEESALVQDLDMSSLASPALEFCVANELVWLENRHLLEADDVRRDFDTRRLGFLLKLTQAGPVFQSQALQHLESAARENIEGLRQAWVARYGQSAA